MLSDPAGDDLPLARGGNLKLCIHGIDTRHRADPARSLQIVDEGMLAESFEETPFTEENKSFRQ